MFQHLCCESLSALRFSQHVTKNQKWRTNLLSPSVGTFAYLYCTETEHFSYCLYFTTSKASTRINCHILLPLAVKGEYLRVAKQTLGKSFLCVWSEHTYSIVNRNTRGTVSVDCKCMLRQTCLCCGHVVTDVSRCVRAPCILAVRTGIMRRMSSGDGLKSLSH